MKSEDRSNLLDLMVKFLESTGSVLLVQGPPGAGKTTLAFELLRRTQGPRIGKHAIAPNRLYISSRTSPTKIRKHFPWINEVVDPSSGQPTRTIFTRGTDDIHVAQADSILRKILSLKHSHQRSLVVIDSWEGALRNTNDDARRMLESVILSQPEESGVSVVLVSEKKDSNDLTHLVDGVVTLSSARVEGRRVRTIFVNKLRGFRVQTVRGLFTLDKGRFTPLSETRLDDTLPTRVSIPEPIIHSETLYSTGSPSLDRMLEGGVRKGSSLLLDLHNTISPIEISWFLTMTCANFVNQGGACFIVPSSSVSSENVAFVLGRCLRNNALNERVRIAEFNSTLPPREWRLTLRKNLEGDVSLFGNCWKELREQSSSLMLITDFDKIAQIYGEELFLPNLSEIGATIRDTQALNLGVASRPTKLREDFLRTADYNLRLRRIGGVLTVYGIKPFTNVHGVKLSIQRGFPYLDLAEVV